MSLSRTDQIERLTTRYDAIIAELATLTNSSIGGKPNSIGPGTHVDHVGYRRSLYDELGQIRQLLILLEGPVEYIHEGWPESGI